MSVETPLQIVTADPHTLALSIRASCLVFEDPASRELLERVQRIAPSNATALIIGETGTGKELIARHIHELSDRRSGPFVAFNCTAISESLMESELFGHESGAFAGMTPAAQALAWTFGVPKTVQAAGEFFLIRSRSLYRRLVHSQHKLRDPEFHFGDFEGAGSTAAHLASQPKRRVL